MFTLKVKQKNNKTAKNNNNNEKNIQVKQKKATTKKQTNIRFDIMTKTDSVCWCIFKLQREITQTCDVMSSNGRVKQFVYFRPPKLLTNHMTRVKRFLTICDVISYPPALPDNPECTVSEVPSEA